MTFHAQVFFSDFIYHHFPSYFATQIRLGLGYPETSPEVVCLNKIYHPNIDLPEEGFGRYAGCASVCVSTIDSDWQPGIGEYLHRQ